MNFIPKSEDELNKKDLLAVGNYSFEVIDAMPHAKNGVEMIMLKLLVDSDRHVHDCLHPAIEYKLRHFCDAAGILSKYELGTLSTDDCAGRFGMCKIAIEEDKTGQYKPKNVVRDYILRPAKPIVPPYNPVDAVRVAAAYSPDNAAQIAAAATEAEKSLGADGLPF